MDLLTIPACYRRYVEDELALIAAGIRRDASRRTDADPRVQRLAWVPDHLIDPADDGTLILTIQTAPAVSADRGESLVAFRPVTR